MPLPFLLTSTPALLLQHRSHYLNIGPVTSVIVSFLQHRYRHFNSSLYFITTLVFDSAPVPLLQHRYHHFNSSLCTSTPFSFSIQHRSRYFNIGLSFQHQSCYFNTCLFTLTSVSSFQHQSCYWHAICRLCFLELLDSEVGGCAILSKRQ